MLSAFSGEVAHMDICGMKLELCLRVIFIKNFVRIISYQ